MAAVKTGDIIRIQYTGKLEDGTVFDCTEENDAFQFVVGKGECLKAFEESVIGMSVGESKTIRIPMEEAYGPYVEEKVFEFDKSRAPQNFEPEIGQQLQMYRADGVPITVTVVGKSDTMLKMDCNHPLAGKDLTFDITIEEIVQE